MDFEFTQVEQEIAELAAGIFAKELTEERFRALDDGVDRALWSTMAEAGLIGISLPSSAGGGDQDFMATAVLLEQAGRYAAPVPLLSTVVTALALAHAGAAPDVVAGVCDGSLVLTFALDLNVSGSSVSGTATCVPNGAIADRILACSASGAAVLVDPSSGGVTVVPERTTSGSPAARVEFDNATGVPVAGVTDFLVDHAQSGICSILAGACKEAVRLTAEYAKTREQFERPIATFQAVAQRAADAYIDAEAVQLTSRQAAWRLSAGLPAAEEVAIAKFFAAEAGQRVVHAAQHIHGGVGVDRSYPLHRYFLLAKELELTLGGTTASLLRLGSILASEPAAL